MCAMHPSTLFSKAGYHERNAFFMTCDILYSSTHSSSAKPCLKRSKPRQTYSDLLLHSLQLSPSYMQPAVACCVHLVTTFTLP